eukprot:628541-Prymnesium_polylepis.1
MSGYSPDGSSLSFCGARLSHAARIFFFNSMTVRLKARRFAVAGVPDTAIRLVGGVFSETLRLEAVNGEIKALPRDSWVIHADVDEFFHYPCVLAEQVGGRLGHEVFCAEMRDALARDGTVGELPPASEAVDLVEEYPNHCYLRQHYLRNASQTPPLSKVVLMKSTRADGSRRAFVDSHHLAGYRRFGFRCRAVGYFDHQTLTAGALRMLRAVKLRRGHQYQRDLASRTFYAAVADFLEAHRQKDARSHPWCQPPPRAAPDNVTMYTNVWLDVCNVGAQRVGRARAT